MAKFGRCSEIQIGDELDCDGEVEIGMFDLMFDYTNRDWLSKHEAKAQIAHLNKVFELDEE